MVLAASTCCIVNLLYFVFSVFLYCELVMLYCEEVKDKKKKNGIYPLLLISL